MARHEIERIKDAEAGALQRIDDAREEARRRVDQARTEAEEIIAKKRREAAEEAARIWEEEEKKAHSDADRLIREANTARESLRVQAEDRIQEAVRLIIREVTGVDDAPAG
ncbi:MAG: hypothetical protein ACP5C4_00650 [Methanomicrobiales archaeon]